MLAAAGIGLFFGAVAFVFALPVFRNLNFWGIQDWDAFLLYHAAPALTVRDYHQFPLWNPWFCGGMPMLARPESPVLSPLFLLSLWLNPLLSLKLQIALHLAIGLGGTYALARSLRATRVAAVLAAFIYMLGGTYAQHIIVGNAWAFAMAFIPWAVLFWLKAVEDGGRKAEAGNPSLSSPPPAIRSLPSNVPRSSLFRLPSSSFCALALVLMWFSGGPYPMVITLLFCAAHALFGVLTRELRLWPTVRQLALVALLTFGLGAIKFLPSTAFTLQHTREAEMSTGFSLDSLRFGLFARDQTLHATDALRKGPGFLHGVSQAVNETGSYVGILPFILFLAGAATQAPRRRALLLCLLFFLWLSFGVRAPLSAWNALHDLPVFSITRVAERFRFIFLLILALGAGWGLDVLAAGVRRLTAWRPAPALVAALVLVFVWVDLMVVVSPLLHQAFTIPPLTMPSAPGRAFAQTASHYAIGPHGDWATAQDDTLRCAWSSHYPALLSNLGIIFGNEDTPVPKEAVAIDDPNYRGEVYVSGARGEAAYVYWSPNELRIRARTDSAGVVVINQNYYPGWRMRGAPGARVEAVNGLMAVRVGPGEHLLTLTYRPASFVWGLCLSLATLAGSIWWLRRARRAPPTPPWLAALAARAPRLQSPTTMAALALVCAAVLAYLPALNAQFVNIDDDLYVTENARVKSGLTLENIRWSFTATERSNYWHPLTWMSHMLDAQLYGLHPAGHHLTSVLLHALNSVLLFLVLARFAGGRKLPVIRYPLSENSSLVTDHCPLITANSSLWPPFLVAALFALHPLHVESVAWISERKDVLSTLFWILTLGAYGRYAQEAGNRLSVIRPTPEAVDASGRRATRVPMTDYQSRITAPIVWYFLTLLCFLCGLMAKPMLVTLPFVLLLLDWWPLGRVQVSTQTVGSSPTPDTRYPKPLRLLSEKLPFFLLAGAAAAWAFAAQREGDALRSLDQYPLTPRLANAAVSYVAYLAQMIWPRGLTVYYPHPGAALPLWQPVGAALLLATITAAVLWNARRRPYLLTGWLWYLGTLVPVIGLVQIGTFARADRYTYVPFIGIFIMLAWGAAEWRTAKCGSAIAQHQTPPWRFRIPHSAFRNLLLPIPLVFLILLSWRQLRHWKDSEALFTHNLAVAGSNAIGHDGLGFALLERGEFAQAATHFEESVRLFPGAVRTHYRLARAYAGDGRIPEAIAAYERALARAPDFADAWLNLGAMWMQIGRIDRAIPCFEAAIRHAPEDPQAYSNLGIALCAADRLEDALPPLQDAVRLKPDSAESRNNLGRALALQNQLPEAEAQLREALRLNPSYRDAHHNLADVLTRLGRADEARAHEQDAAAPAP